MTVKPAQPPILFAIVQNPLMKETSFILLLHHQIMQNKVTEELVMAHEGLVQTRESLTISPAAMSSQLDNSIAKTKTNAILGFMTSLYGNTRSTNLMIHHQPSVHWNYLPIMGFIL